MILPKSIFGRVSHVGLSISPYAIRAVIVNANKEITQKAEVTSPELLISGDEVNQEVFENLITQIKQQLNLESFYAACCIPEKLAYSREHSLPKIPHSEIDEAVRWQLGTIFPLQPDDIYTDWKLLGESDQGIRVIITAVSKKILDSLVAGFLKNGIKPLGFESSASSLSRTIEETTNSSIIIELDNYGSSSTLVENGVSSLTITTNFSSAQDSQSAITDIATTITQLQSRVVSSDKEKKSEIPLYITGEKAAPEIIQVLSQSLGGTEIKQLSNTSVENKYFSAYVESLTSVEAPESSKTINLLPMDLRQQYVEETELSQLKALAKYNISMSAIVSMLSIALCVTSYIFLNNARNQGESIPEPPALTANIDLPTLLQKSQKITQLQSAENFPQEATETLLSQLNGANVRQLSYDASKKTFKITIGTINRNVLFQIKQSLEETDLYKQITIPLSALDSDESQDVVLTAALKD